MRANTKADTMGARRAPIVSRSLKILLHAVLVSLVVSIITFLLVRLTPGDPVLLLLGEQATPEAVERLREQLGLNGSVPEQFVNYMAGLLRGDLGVSISYRVPVGDLIARAMPVTLGLMGMTALFAVVLSIPTAVYLARRPDGILSRVYTVWSAAAIAAPAFFVGLLALLVFGLWWRIAPIAGIGDNIFEAIGHLWLPAAVICVSLVPVVVRVLRASILATADEEFVEAAIVRGVSPTVFTIRYLLRPSIAPTVSLLSYLIASMFASAVVIELVFGLPGVGALLVKAVSSRDYPIVQGVTLIAGVLVVLVTTIADIVSTAIDPRTRIE